MPWEQYLQALLALIFVVGLIGIISLIARKFSLESFLVKENAEAKQKNLSIIEVLPLDTKRRLLLVKNGKRKHLLLLGINGDLVVESYDE